MKIVGIKYFCKNLELSTKKIYVQFYKYNSNINGRLNNEAYFDCMNILKDYSLKLIIE